MEISPHKMQLIPTNCHFCHRWEAFLSSHFFVISSLFRRYPTIIAEDNPRFGVDKMLLFLTPGIARVSWVTPSSENWA